MPGDAERVLRTVAALNRPGLARVICFEPAERAGEVAEWAGSAFLTAPQADADRGGKLEHAFVSAFHRGARRVVAIGAECTWLTAEILDEAFDALADGGDAALGPGLDGGWYLLGLSRPCHHVFRGIPYNSDRAMHVTLSRLRGCGLCVRLLPPLRES